MGKGFIPDAGDTVRDINARQVGAITEGFIPDAGDGLAFDIRRYG